MGKRILSILLAYLLILGVRPLDVVATEQPLSGDDIKESIEYQSSDSIGEILVNALDEEENAKNQAYYISNILIEGNLATVNYVAEVDCNLIVAVYSEDEVQMLAVGTESIKASEQQTTVEVNEGTIPKYFVVKAYLVEEKENYPLCDTYVNKNYTQEFQEFLALTIDDFDENRTINLDNDNATNFVVLKEDVKIIEPQEGINVIESADYENDRYVFGQVDENITSLQVGDIFSYQYNETDILVVEVAAIDTNRATVTITGADTSMKDVFSHVKIEGEESLSETEIDNSDLEEGITFEGSEIAARTRASVEGSTSKSFAYNLDYKVSDNQGTAVKIQGKLKFSVKVSIKAYLYWDYQYIEAKLDMSLQLSGSVGGEVKSSLLELGSCGISPVPGVYVGFTPAIVLKADAKIALDLDYKGVVGMAYDSKNGFINKSSAPKVSNEFKVEGSIFLGVSLEPHVAILHEKVAKVSIDAEYGVQLDGKLCSGVLEQEKSQLHACLVCLDGELSRVLKVSASVAFANSTTLSADIINGKAKISDFYYSVDYDEFGWSTCPRVSNKIEIFVVDVNNQPLAKATVSIEGKDENYSTDEDGKCSFYLRNGQYIFGATVNGYTRTVKERVHDESTSFQITWTPGAIAEGKLNDDITWELTGDGILTIIGTGEMNSYGNKNGYSEWSNYKDDIKKIIIKNGITSIKNSLINRMENLEYIKIPNSVQEIESGTFYRCTSLKNITIPNSVKKIGEQAFGGCTDLTDVEIKGEVKEIGERMFSGCTNLKNIELPQSVEKIGLCAFQDCDELESIELPAALKIVGSWAFWDCKKLSSIELPEGLESIEERAFSDCRQLGAINIPDSVTEVGMSAFYQCDSLETVRLPERITNLEKGTFADCVNLREIYLPEGITKIGECAFLRCKRLESIVLSADLEVIEYAAFSDCTSLTTVNLPSKVTTIGNRAFVHCTNLQEVYLSENLTHIGDNAFEWCVITSITIPYKVESIGVKAFNYNLKLKNIIFEGNAPTIGADAFYGTSASLVAYFYKNTQGWTEEVMQDYGNEWLTWSELDASGFTVREDSALEKGEIFEPEEEIKLSPDEELENNEVEETLKLPDEELKNSELEKGEYVLEQMAYQSSGKSYKAQEVEIEVSESQATGGKTTSYKNLDPNQPYILLWVKSDETEELISAGNILYVDQKESDENGKISFEYLLREEDGDAVPLLYGGTLQDVTDADISITDLTYTGKEQDVNIIVRLGEKELVVFKDYVLGGSTSVTEVGTYRITLRGCGKYTGSNTKLFSVVKSPQTISGTSTYSKTYGNATFKLDAKVSAGDGKLSYTSSNEKVVMVDSAGKATIKGAGTATVSVKAASTKNFESAIKTVTIKVGKTAQSISAKSYTKTYGTKAFSLGAKRTAGNGKLTYKSSNTKVVAVSSDGKITVKGTGKATITITAVATTNYKETTKKITIKVIPKKATLSSVKSSTKKKATVTLKKDSMATGYQIQYSTSSSFKSGNKTKSITKNTTVKKTLTGLESGKKYYVRVRSYKTIDGRKEYGSWSTKSSVKVK